MDIRQLEAFVAVAERLNFSRAAESLYITQPALSKQIAELEYELHAPLFTRSKRMVLLTKEGASILPIIKEILRCTERIPDIIQNCRDCTGYPSKLDIGIDEKLFRNMRFRLLVLHGIDALKSQYPIINFNFNLFDREQLARDIARGGMDVGIMMRYSISDHDKNNHFILFQDKLVIVISKSKLAGLRTCDPIEIIAQMDILLLSGDMEEQIQMLSIFSDTNTQPHLKTSEDKDIAFMRLYAGEGILLIPKYIASEYDTDEFVSIELPEDSSRLYYTICWNEKNYNENIQLLTRALKEQFDLVDLK